MIPPHRARALLSEYGMLAKKSLSQSFLIEPGVVEKIVAAAEIGPDDRVIEIGPGLGVMTARLCDLARSVVAVEIDERMVRILTETVGARPNLTVVQADALDVDLAALGEGPYTVAANLPYAITSLAIRRMLEADTPPKRIVVMIQKEVAERICAKPGKLNLLAVSVQVYGTPKITSGVAASCFFPRPNVESAILRIDPHATPLLSPAEREHFFRVVSAGFGEGRKQLHNSLSRRLWFPDGGAQLALQDVGIDPTRRAQTLTVDDWLRLARRILQQA